MTTPVSADRECLQRDLDEFLRFLNDQITKGRDGVPADAQGRVREDLVSYLEPIVDECRRFRAECEARGIDSTPLTRLATILVEIQRKNPDPLAFPAAFRTHPGITTRDDEPGDLLAEMMMATTSRLQGKLRAEQSAAAGELAAGNALSKEAKAKPRQKRPQRRTPTEAQLEALKVVGECGQNFAEAGRRLKKDPKTVRGLFKAGLRNAGKLAAKLIGKPKTTAAPHDTRGQLDVVGEDDGPAAIGPRSRARRNRR